MQNDDSIMGEPLPSDIRDIVERRIDSYLKDRLVEQIKADRQREQPRARIIKSKKPLHKRKKANGAQRMVQQPTATIASINPYAVLTVDEMEDLEDEEENPRI